MQWRVTVTDSNKEDHVYIVEAAGERTAQQKGRDYFRKQVPGAQLVTVKAVVERKGT